jgi:hypothetical protein
LSSCIAIHETLPDFNLKLEKHLWVLEKWGGEGPRKMGPFVLAIGRVELEAGE